MDINTFCILVIGIVSIYSLVKIWILAHYGTKAEIAEQMRKSHD